MPENVQFRGTDGLRISRGAPEVMHAISLGELKWLAGWGSAKTCQSRARPSHTRDHSFTKSQLSSRRFVRLEGQAMFQIRLPFRTRSPDRDRQTDVNRLGTIASAVDGQLTEIGREMAGLKARMDQAYLSATSLLEASGEYAVRSAEEEAEIRAFEASASAARRRIGELEQQKALLEQIRSILISANTGLREAAKTEA